MREGREADQRGGALGVQCGEGLKNILQVRFCDARRLDQDVGQFATKPTTLATLSAKFSPWLMAIFFIVLHARHIPNDFRCQVAHTLTSALHPL
jgi:hypothetical protein